MPTDENVASATPSDEDVAACGPAYVTPDVEAFGTELQERCEGASPGWEVRAIRSHAALAST